MVLLRVGFSVWGCSDKICGWNVRVRGRLPAAATQLPNLPPTPQICWFTTHTVFGDRCVDALRQLETAEGWSHPAVGLLALQAFFATGNTQQVEVEAAGACD